MAFDFFPFLSCSRFHHAWQVVYHYEECSHCNCYLFEYDSPRVYHLLSIYPLYRLPEAITPRLIADPLGDSQIPQADPIRLPVTLEKSRQPEHHSAAEHLRLLWIHIQRSRADHLLVTL